VMSILGQPSVADFGEPKLPLDDTEYMFDLRTDTCFVAIASTFFITERPVAVTFVLREVAGIGRMCGDDGLFTGVGRVSPHTGLIAMQQIFRHHRVELGALMMLASTSVPRATFRPFSWRYSLTR